MSEIIVLVGREGELIGAVEMAVGKNHDVAWPSQPGDHNSLMPASYMFDHHGMQQGASSTEAGGDT